MMNLTMGGGHIKFHQTVFLNIEPKRKLQNKNEQTRVKGNNTEQKVS